MSEAKGSLISAIHRDVLEQIKDDMKRLQGEAR